MIKIYAQTNIQLFNQLIEQGYSEVDLQHIFAAYQLAIELFTGRFRPSGKPFLCHLIGTASVLGYLKLPMAIVSAGLLHSAYTHGDFGLMSKKAKSDRVRQAIGDEAEDYLTLYSQLLWKKHTIPNLYQQLDSLEAKTQQVILIRLANELEEHSDLGLLYCGHSRRHEQYRGQTGQIMVDMAAQLGFPDLATELSQAFQNTANANVIDKLTNPIGERYSTLVMPHSCRQHFLIQLQHTLFKRPSGWSKA